MTEKMRNIAIIAHVDHGKTTFVNALFKQSGLFRANQVVDDRLMDNNDQERERGITILSKCTSIMADDVKINILDTPGHADFGAEVERVLLMVDGFLLIVDAAEGVMPQTKFVLRKAMEHKLKPIVVINKIDSPIADPERATEEVMELLFSFDPDSIYDVPVFYGSGRDGYAASTLEKAREAKDLSELIGKIVSYINPPVEDPEVKFLTSMVEMDKYFGKLLIGKIFGGKISVGQSVLSVNQEKNINEKFRVNKLFSFSGVTRQEITEASCGDIVAIAGSTISTVNDTVCTEVNVVPAPTIDPATISVVFSANTSPLAGKEGNKLTSRHIKERLIKESEVNVGIKIEDMGESFEVRGRGELQLSVLIESMRREGFELTISAPQILFKKEGGKTLEPMEEVQLDVGQEDTGTVIQKLSERGGEFKETISRGDNVRLIFEIPTRLLFGYASEFISDTKGTGVMSKRFVGYVPLKDSGKRIRKGVLVSMAEGLSSIYAMEKLIDRGIFFIKPGVTVYPGMIVGESNKAGDLEINVVKVKQLTNMRAAGKDDMIKIPPATPMPLERALTYIMEDECIEITPTSIRLRKVKY